VMRSVLFEVPPRDVVTLIVAPLVFATVALIACVIPARRAARTDPTICLRGD